MSSSPRRSLAIPALLSIALGIWTGCGGAFIALGSLSPNSEVPDSPMLSSGQLRAMRGFVEAAAAYEPVSGALGALASLIGILLVVAGVLVLVRAPQHALIGRVAFGAALVVDLLGMIWSILWYLVLYGPMADYVEGIVRSSPNPPPDVDEALGLATVIAVAICIVFNAGYYAVKVAMEAWGLWMCTRSDHQAQSDDEWTPPGKGEPGLDWADS